MHPQKRDHDDRSTSIRGRPLGYDQRQSKLYTHIQQLDVRRVRQQLPPVDQSAKFIQGTSGTFLAGTNPVCPVTRHSPQMLADRQWLCGNGEQPRQRPSWTRRRLTARLQFSPADLRFLAVLGANEKVSTMPRAYRSVARLPAARRHECRCPHLGDGR
jgi:hypothetical protein